jgi:hypothetical protein
MLLFKIRSSGRGCGLSRGAVTSLDKRAGRLDSKTREDTSDPPEENARRFGRVIFILTSIMWIRMKI